jgi:hypothetical protein
MSFFDKFRTRASTVADAASDVAKNAAKQTKNLAAVGRLKLAITSEEDKMKKAYTELGRLFFRDYEAQTEADMEEYQPWIDKISDAKAQSARLNDEIVKIRTEEPAEEVAKEAQEGIEEITDGAAQTAEETSKVVVEAVEEAVETATEAAEETPAPTVNTFYVDETNFEE